METIKAFSDIGILEHVVVIDSWAEYIYESTYFQDFESNFGAPGGIRTHGLLIRSQALYPAELRAHY